MKRILIMGIIGLMFYSGKAQAKWEEQKLTKAEKKEIKTKQEAKTKAVIDSIIWAKQFVLEADNIKCDNGTTFPVSSIINFVLIDSLQAVFQFGSANLIGINGVGGVTVEGDITSYEVKKNDKSSSFFIQLNISSNSGFYSVIMHISASGYATAEVVALSNNKINYTGRVVPLFESMIYIGRSF